MKKMFFATMFAMILFASCENENVSVNENLNAGETKSVFMKLEQASSLRAETDKVTDYSVEFSSGFMYFVDASKNITKRFTINGNATTGNNLNIGELKGGIYDIMVPQPSTEVYVIANVPEVVVLPDAGNYSAVEAKVIEAASQEGSIVEVTTNKYAIKGVMLYSSEPGELKESSKGAGDWSATVEPVQIANRIEITDIKAKDNSGLNGFKVEGIYVNHFYKDKTIGAPAASLVNYLSDPEKYAAGKGLYSKAGVFYDEPNKGHENLKVAAGEGMVWGYNLLAGEKTPHIVIKLSNIEVSNGYEVPSYIKDSSSNAFITVKGFVDKDGVAINFQNGGYVFSIGANDLEFGLSDITEFPEVDEIKVKVTVKLIEWEPVSVKPII